MFALFGPVQLREPQMRHDRERKRLRIVGMRAGEPAIDGQRLFERGDRSRGVALPRQCRPNTLEADRKIALPSGVAGIGG